MRLTRLEFNGAVENAMEELPTRIQSVLENVAVLVEDWPGHDDVDAGHMEGRECLFGLYTGVPLPEREGGPPPLPDVITLFKRPIESACGSREQVVHEIRVTLLHEVGHYLGMSEEDLERLGFG